MTKILSFVFVLISGLAISQTTLTQTNNEPIVGDSKGVYNLDTTFYTTGLPTAITGTNVTWDFSNLAVTPTLITTNYISPASATVTAPAGSTYAEEQNGSYNFYKSVTSPTTQTEILSVKFGTIALTFTNTGIVARYPINYGYSLTDAVGGTVTFSLPATFSGSVTTTADGTGTLLMPQGNTFNNVLRMKSVQTITVSVFLLGNIATIKQTVYQYYNNSSKFPLLTINNTVNTFSTTTTRSNSATGNSSFLAISVKENTRNDLAFEVYPNPASHTAYIQLPETKIAEKIEVINTLGQVIRIVTNANSIAIQDLPKGIYHLQVTHNGQTGRKPLVIAN